MLARLAATGAGAAVDQAKHFLTRFGMPPETGEQKLASSHVEKQLERSLDRQKFLHFAPAAYDHWVHVEMQRMADRRVQLYLFFERPKSNSWSGALKMYGV